MKGIFYEFREFCRLVTLYERDVNESVLYGESIEKSPVPSRQSSSK